MKKLLTIAALAVVMAVSMVSFARAQTATPTMTPSPTSVPGGAPSTGHGTL